VLVGECWGGGLQCAVAMHAAQLTSMRRLDRLPQVVRALLPDVIVSAASQLSAPNVACWKLPHLERSSWTMRSSADDSALCCAIVSASPGASGRKGRQLRAFHRQEDAVLVLVCTGRLDVFAVLESCPPTAGVQAKKSMWVLPLTELPMRQHL
jgi:hypothetical protein